MTWFKTLTGVEEISPQQVRDSIVLDGETLSSRTTNQSMHCGRLETPRLIDLQQRLESISAPTGNLSVHEVVASVQDLHADPANKNSMFQVASQFNLLEMISPSVTPEEGITRYESDHTQGPACAVAAGAGTIYRNYFVPVNGQTGQSAGNQIDCLADIGVKLGNTDNSLWEMKNGYALASVAGLNRISERLESSTDVELDQIRQLLRIGIQWQTEVTIAESKHKVSQAYCSALPVAYSRHSSQLWAPFAQLILEASYEAILCAAILNCHDNNSNQLYLTLLGGGAFGNRKEWIINAITRALNLHSKAGLDVVIVSYSHSDSDVCTLADQFTGR